MLLHETCGPCLFDLVKSELCNGVGHHQIYSTTPMLPGCWTPLSIHHRTTTTTSETILSPTLELAIHQSSRRHQNTALHSSTALEALAKVRAQFQAKLPASSGKARPPGIHYLGPHPCSTYRRAWIIQRTYLLTSLCHSPAAFCSSVLYSIHCDIVTRPVVHQI